MMPRLSLYLTLICAIVFPLNAYSAEFFNDSFESGDLSYTGSNGAYWSSSGNTSVSTDMSHTGSYSLKFTFAGNPDVNVDATAEQRFSLNDTYDEVYIRFYVFFPSNYTLRSTPSTENTKLFYLWGDDYQADMNKVGIEFETALSGWPKAKKDWEGLTCSGDTGYMPGLSGPGVDIAGARGRWTAIEIHTRRDTGSGDGIMQVWQDGSLVASGENLSWVGAPCGLNKFFRNGYLLGWSNAGFDNDTFVYIDDVVFSTSYIGVGSTPPVTDGECGSSDGGTFSAAPTTGLCAAGTAGTVSLTDTTYSWSCAGVNGGTTDNCTASYVDPVPDGSNALSINGSVLTNAASTTAYTIGD